MLSVFWVFSFFFYITAKVHTFRYWKLSRLLIKCKIITITTIGIIKISWTLPGHFGWNFHFILTTFKVECNRYPNWEKSRKGSKRYQRQLLKGGAEVVYGNSVCAKVRVNQEYKLVVPLSMEGPLLGEWQTVQHTHMCAPWCQAAWIPTPAPPLPSYVTF